MFGRREIVSRRADKSLHRYTYADCAARTRRLATALRRPRRPSGRPRRHARLESRTSTSRPTSASRSSAACSTRSISASIPTSSPTSSTTRRIALVLVDETLLPLWEQVRPHVSVADDDRGRRRPSRCRTAYPGIRIAARGLRAGDRPARARTKTTRSRCATRPAPPARRKACSTRIARSCCTRFGLSLDGCMGIREADVVLAGRADVPRQRVGHAVRRGDERREDGHARTAPRSGQPRRSVPERARHHHRRACRRSGWACCSISTRTPASSICRPSRRCTSAAPPSRRR